MPKTSSVDAAIVAAHAPTEALTNPAHTAPFSQFGDAQQQAIVGLGEIFEITIAKPALPIVVPPQPAVLTVPPPSQRVTFNPVSPMVPLPVHPNFVKPDYNGDNINAVAFPRYQLWLHRQHRPLAKQEPHQIAANTSAIVQTYSPGVSYRFSRATRNLIAIEHRRTNHTNTMIDTVTGQYLEYCHLIYGPNKDVWMTSLANDLGRIAQGVGTQMPEGTNTVFLCPEPQSLPVAQ